MTETIIENPYLTEYRKHCPYGGNLLDIFEACGPGKPVSISTAMAFATRFDVSAEYAWAVPDTEALGTLAGHGPLIEIGAGSGYWAWLLQTQYDVDILAYDRRPPRRPDTRRYTFTKRWTTVRHGGPAVLQAHPDRTLFLCWQPYDQPMAAQCLKYYRGNTLCYIGEGAGGCTGSEAFHARLEDEWIQIQHVAIPQWPGIYDALWVYARK